MQKAQGALNKYEESVIKCLELEEVKVELEGEVLMITSSNNASKNECPMRLRRII